MFVGSEYTHPLQYTGACLSDERACSWPRIYTFIAMAQVDTLFAISGAVEHRMENASSYQEWRR